MHSEAKQTETSEFGAEKGLCEAPSKNNPSPPELPNDFQGRVFKGKIWGEGYGMSGFLLIG